MTGAHAAAARLPAACAPRQAKASAGLRAQSIDQVCCCFVARPCLIE